MRALARDVQIAGEHAVGDDRQRLVGVAALAEDDLLHAELLGGLGVLDGGRGRTGVVVPETVVDAVVSGDLAGQRPAQAGRLEDEGERAGVLRPGHDLAGVVDEQDVGALNLSQGVSTVMPVISETSSSMNSMLSLTTTRAFMPVEEPTFELQHGAVLVQLLRVDAHLHG